MGRLGRVGSALLHQFRAQVRSTLYLVLNVIHPFIVGVFSGTDATLSNAVCSPKHISNTTTTMDA